MKTKSTYSDWLTQVLVSRDRRDLRHDAEFLLAHVLNYSKLQLFTETPTWTDAKREHFLTMLDQLCDQRPLAHLLGSAWFYGREFFVNENVLIPRQDTEILIDVCLEEMSKFSSIYGRIPVVDLGTGSGIIPLTLSAESSKLEHHGEFSFFGVDVSPLALDVARKNKQMLSISDVCFELSDVLSQNFWKVPPVKIDGEQTVLWISNPPYIASDEIGTLDKSVVQFEPLQALTDSNDGLTFYHEFAEKVPTVSHRSAWMAVEVGYQQAESVCDIFAGFGWKSIKTFKDRQGYNRVVTACWGVETAM